MLCCVSRRAASGPNTVPDWAPAFMGAPLNRSKNHKRSEPEVQRNLGNEIHETKLEEEDEPPVLLPCATCARTFKQESLEKHTKICQRQAAKKRKPFDSAKQRIQGTDLAEFLPKQGRRRTAHDDKPSKSNASWKQTHDEFLRAIRAARGETDESPPRYQEKHPKVPTALAAPTRGNEKGTCPSCNRQFGIKAYDRHVAWCKERANRMPVNSATAVAKERLEARMRYRAPALRNRRTTNREKYSPSSATGITGNGTGSGRISASGAFKVKESSSVPVCSNPQKSKPVVGRRSVQTRESPLTSGPLKSRLSDRMTKRPKEEKGEEIEVEDEKEEEGYKSFRSTNRTSQIRSNLSVLPTKLEKYPKIKSPRKFVRRSTDRILKSKANYICAKGFENPKLNDVAINDEVVSMTVQPCNIHRSDDLVTWKQIGDFEKSKNQGKNSEYDYEGIERSIQFDLEDFENATTYPDESDVEISPVDRKRCEFNLELESQSLRAKMQVISKSHLTEDFDESKDRGPLLLKETEKYLENGEVNVSPSSIFGKLKCMKMDSENDLEINQKYAGEIQKLNQTYLIKESDDRKESIENLSFSFRETSDSPKTCNVTSAQEEFEIHNKFQIVSESENANGFTGWSGGLKVMEQTNQDLDNSMFGMSLLDESSEIARTPSIKQVLNGTNKIELVSNLEPALHSKYSINEDSLNLENNVFRYNADSLNQKDSRIPHSEKNCNFDDDLSNESIVIESHQIEYDEVENDTDESSPKFFSGNEIQFSNTPHDSSELDEISQNKCESRLRGDNSNLLDIPNDDLQSDSTCPERNASKFHQLEESERNLHVDHESSKESIVIESHENDRAALETRNGDLSSKMELKNECGLRMNLKHDENPERRCGTYVIEERSNSLNSLNRDSQCNSITLERNDSIICQTKVFQKDQTNESIASENHCIEIIRVGNPKNDSSSRNSIENEYQLINLGNNSSKPDGNSKQRCGTYVIEKSLNSLNYDDLPESTSFKREDSKIPKLDQLEKKSNSDQDSSQLNEIQKPKIELAEQENHNDGSLPMKGSENECQHSKSQNNYPKQDGNPKRRCGTYVIKKSPNSQTNHNVSNECFEDKPLEKRRKTKDYKNRYEINDPIDYIGKNKENEIDKEVRRVYKKYVNNDFNDDSDNAVNSKPDKIMNSDATKTEKNLNAKRGIDSRIKRKMNILKRSTDVLISSSESALMSSQSSLLMQSENHEIRASKKNFPILGTNAPSSFLPHIKSELPVKSGKPKISSKSEVAKSSYWEKAEKMIRSKLLTQGPSNEEFRILKRNPNIHILPSVNPIDPSNLERSDRNLDYDPFLAAERQMNELFSDTSDQSVTDSHEYSPQDYSPSHEPIQVPLSHSSAFVEFPSSLSSSVKRESVIAPPSEFDDFISDFSSDSTETNSTSREFRMNNLNAQTRNVIIDKTKPSSAGDSNSNQNRGKPCSPSAAKSRKTFAKISPKIIRPMVTRSFSVRVPSAPKVPERKSSVASTKKSASKVREFSNMCKDDFGRISGSNMSLSSILSSEMDLKRSNSVFDELMSSFEDDGSSFPSLKSFLKSDSLTVSSPIQGSEHRNGQISDEGLSSPDSYKRQDQSKLSADSAYSSLNRKCSNHGRSTTDVAARFEEEERPSRRREADRNSAKSKMSKFCHECGSKFPTTAKFCCECGVKRLTL